ncbi:piggyBac transposable element-derived protein 4-like [Trachinotus anak]|uniref:piggyBac transposable element-derived protein 4-like n=1 Tax=Trachinotus anak TaxID=443729 RepID=UPI0039F1F22D
MSRRLTKRFSVKEVLVQVFGHDEEGTEIEPEIEEDVSEVEDNTDFDPDFEETDQSTDGEGEAPEEQAPEETFQSKSGHLLWSSSPQDRGRRARVENIIKLTPGPTRYVTSHVDDIKSSFHLFLPESIEGIILEMTNLEGKRVFGDTWREIDLVDLQAYIGLLIFAGVYRSNNEATKSLWDAESGRPIFRATMSLQQFHVLSRIIGFDNRDTQPVRWRNDKLAAIRNIWDTWVERLSLMYNPGPEVIVDERLVPVRGRCSFKVYIPSKPGKYGIKIWAACDARSSYAWNMQVNMGKPSTGRAEKNQGMCVVLDMTAGLQGHNITCDNFFTSYALGQELLKRKLTMVGTVRKNKPELPPALVSTRGREALSSKFALTDTHTLVSYVPKKNRNVILMSTLHKNAAVSTTEDRKPLMTQDYNKNKGGYLDKLTGTYTCKRMTARWPVALFHNILDVSAFNAYVVWTAIHPTWNQGKSFKRRLFLAELGKALVTPLIQRRQHIPRTPASASRVRSVQAPAPAAALAALPQQGHGQKRKRCELCAPRDNKTSLRCCKCDAYVCKAHSDLSVTCHSCA